MFQVDPIAKLSDIDYSRADTFGERACSLSRFLSKGYNVPFGIVISTKVFKRFLNTMPGTKRIDHLILNINSENIEKTAREIQEIILNSPVPMPMANSIADEIYQLWDRIGSENVVVRTSAHVEDSSRHLCYGRGVYFHLKDIRNIIQIMKNCWASAFTIDVLTDLIRAGLPPDNVRIAVIVEKMVKAKVSGILSIRSDEEKGKGVHIRANWGTQAHEGRNGISCDQVIIDESKFGEPIEIFTSFKEKMYHIPPDNQHAIIIENEPDKKLQLSLSQENITILNQLAKKIRKDFEVDYEVEFVFDHEGVLWLLDATSISTHKSFYRIGAKNYQLNHQE